MKNADTLMVIYYAILSGVLVFTLGYFAGWRHAKGANPRPRHRILPGSTRTAAPKLAR